MTGVNLSQTTASMTVGGDALTLTPTVLPADATDKTVTWTTSDASVATVSTDGVVTAVAAGTATITATATNGTADTADDKTATCTVTVSPAGPTTYTVTLADGTEDAANWQAKVGSEGAFTVLPVEGLEGGETVTIQYNGTRRIKSITAVQTAAAEEQQEQAVTTATPLTMECLSDGTIVVDISGTLSTGMQWAKNGGAKTKITGTTTIGDLKAGDKVQFYGVGTETQVYGGDVEVKIAGGSATVKVYGNIMSLLDETGFATKTDLPSSQKVFSELFKDNANLTDAGGLLLPATTLAQKCYQGMFRGCTALTAAPALPATELTQNCYYNMFYECTALTAAPELPATTMVDRCYYGMFYGCSNLASVTCKATSITATDCLYNWLQYAGESVTSPTLYVDPSMKENTGWKNGAFTVKAITAGGSEPVAATYTMAADADAGDVGKLICTDGHIHAYNADADCTKSRVAKIVYVGSETGDATYTHGLALALADESTNGMWAAANTACSGKNTSAKVTSASWMLPSKAQWQTMGATDEGYTALPDGFSGVGGTNLEPTKYWSSTESMEDSDNAWDFDFLIGEWDDNDKSNEYYVRACLAF